MIIPTQNALALSTPSSSVAENVESEMQHSDGGVNDVGNAIKFLYITQFVAKFAELGWKFCIGFRSIDQLQIHDSCIIILWPLYRFYHLTFRSIGWIRH